MDFEFTAKQLFNGPKPSHFTNFTHCEECFEHDQTLLNTTVDDIGLEELGNPAWNPLCFSSPEGILYYMPALVRLSMETIDDAFYFGQLLFTLESDGPDNALFCACTPEQRQFIKNFIAYMIEHFAEQIEANYYADNALRCFEVWDRV
jgi:hypothetical protein